MSEQPRKPDDVHDAAIDAAWHREPAEEPSTSVDASIRSAARHEIGSTPVGRASPRPVTRRDRRWTSFAAAAAVAVLAFGVMRWLPPQQDVAPPLQPASSEHRAPESAAESVLSPRNVDSGTPAPVEDRESRRDALEPSSVPHVGDDDTPLEAPGPTRSTAPAATAAPAPAAAPPHAARTEAAADASSTTSIASKAAPMHESASGAVAATLSSDEWVDAVVAAHRAGNFDDAAELLRRFRAEYIDADTRLPKALQTWASGIAH